MKRFLATVFGVYLMTVPFYAQTLKLPADCQRILESKFRSWKLASIKPEIVEYYKRDRSFELPNLIKGDWNGDGRIDFAAMLQKETDSTKRITISFVRAGNTYRTFILGANDCIMSLKRGQRDFNFDNRTYFRYKNDAIFDYIWEKAGSSYVWAKNRFRIITTSD